MTAQRVSIFTIDFPDPYVIDYDNNKFNTLNDTLSFQYRILADIQTLSTKDVDPSSDPYGILYVPDLQSDACRASEHDHVPANATRIANLPVNKNYALIALAPWYDPVCMTEYFAAARRSPTKAVLVYQPGQNNTKPPVLNDPSWDLNDGGAWQLANTFPTYAIPPLAGSIVMDQLKQYSGNLSNVPHGPDLASMYNTSDYVRLWATVSTDTSSQLPSLWVFLVIVMAILLLAVSGTSIAMHVIQRRRRRALRQRVLDGQVDLEALGVKRLTVPRHILDKLPIYTYTAASPDDDAEKAASQLPDPLVHQPSSSAHAETGDKSCPPVRPSSESTLPTNSTTVSWSQPTCPICLDDYVLNETQVRELPCRHVFHPDCIDTFLLRNSSLCPLCKQSVLPKGDCPVTITNLMVRRERHITRMRARSANTANGQGATSPHAPSSIARRLGVLGMLPGRLGRLIGRRHTPPAPEQTQPTPSDIEMGTTNPTSQPPDIPPPIDPPAAPSTGATTQECEPSQNRREWARQRALAMLGQRHAPPTDIDEAHEPGPRWRQIFRKIFPGFR